MPLKQRPKTLSGPTYHVVTGCGKLKVTFGEDGHGELLEVVVKLGKGGTCASVITSSIGLLLSKELRSGLDMQAVRTKLSGAVCQHPMLTTGGAKSCADAIAIAIGMYLDEKSKRGLDGSL